MPTLIVAKDQEEPSFHEQVVAREIARDDAWIKETIREKADERKRRTEETQSGKNFSPEEKAA